ncbi:MAG: DNA double-strand break repair nuclease NurA [Methylocystaceae bacterium]
MPSPEFVQSIRELDRQLGEGFLQLPPLSVTKQHLTSLGRLIQLGNTDINDLKHWLQHRSIAACDGSRLEFGPFFPHTVVLQRAMAIVSQHQDTVTEISCCTPLIPSVSLEIEEMARHKTVSPAEVYPRWLQRKLAALEVKVAAQAIEQWQPRLMLMDGGLLLFDTLPGWNDLLAAAARADTLVAGVIEEIATAELAPRLHINRRPVYDRELLFGLLEPGEVLILDKDKPIKKEYRTVFTRFSTRPAAAACDFLPGTSENDIIQCIKLLYAATGSTGRGVPFLLDLVDRKVRLTHQEGEVILKMGLSNDTYEKLFTSQRQQRNI